MVSAAVATRLDCVGLISSAYVIPLFPVSSFVSRYDVFRLVDFYRLPVIIETQCCTSLRLIRSCCCTRSVLLSDPHSRLCRSARHFTRSDRSRYTVYIPTTQVERQHGVGGFLCGRTDACPTSRQLYRRRRHSHVRLST